MLCANVLQFAKNNGYVTEKNVDKIIKSFGRHFKNFIIW